MKPTMRQAPKHGSGAMLGWIASIAFALLAVSAQHVLARGKGPPWEIPCVITFLTLVLLQFDALALQLEARTVPQDRQTSGQCLGGREAGPLFRLWPLPLLSALGVNGAFFVGFSLRWGLRPLSYCLLPILICFCAMSVTHFSLIRRVRRLLAVCTGSGTSPLDAGQRRRLRLYYGVICLIIFSGFALLWLTSRPWRLKAMVRSGTVLSSFGIIAVRFNSG